MPSEKPLARQENNWEIIPPGAVMALERAAIDSQVATAHAYPRSIEQFKKRATGMATLDLLTAESCIYRRPVGDGKTAEGASIRMAEIVSAAYGNLRVASRIIEQTERYVKCEGVAHDLETNYAGKMECIEPTIKRDGNPYSEAQRAVAAKACLAKAYRDAVFKVVPKALCKPIIDAARSVIRKEMGTLTQRRERAREWLAQIRVDEKRAFGVLGVKGWSEVTDDHLEILTGLKTAIQDRETTISEAFPIVIMEAKVEPVTKISNGEGAGTSSTQPGEPPSSPAAGSTEHKSAAAAPQPAPPVRKSRRLKPKPEPAPESKGPFESMAPVLGPNRTKLKEMLMVGEYNEIQFLEVCNKHEWLGKGRTWDSLDTVPDEMLAVFLEPEEWPAVQEALEKLPRHTKD